MTDNENIEKLLLYQQELQTEEEHLKQIIKTINSQIHALQVEQLHILNSINKTSVPTTSTSTNLQTVYLKNEKVDTETQELDLSVPKYQSCEEDEDDEVD